MARAIMFRSARMVGVDLGEVTAEEFLALEILEAEIEKERAHLQQEAVNKSNRKWSKVE